MSNLVYPLALAKFLQAGINMSSGSIKAVAVDTADYAYSATHAALSDIPSGARVGTSSALTNKTFTGGVFDADDTYFPSVTGDEFEAIILYIDSGTESTSYLIAYIDTATGLPFTPAGNDANISWPASGIFRI
jgi:hypothetical protein